MAPLINGDDFIKHVTYENCFYLYYSLRWSCALRNSVIPAPRYHEKVLRKQWPLGMYV